MNTRIVDLSAQYRDPDEPALDAYETLLLDVIEGDRSLFIRFDEVEWAWRVVDPILRTWSHEDNFIHSYAAGTWGPTEAGTLFRGCEGGWSRG